MLEVLHKCDATYHWTQRRIWELGSGTGLVAMCLASLGADVTASDKASAMDLLSHNITHLNRTAPTGTALKAVLHDWSSTPPEEMRRCDVLIACEVLYEACHITDSTLVNVFQNFLMGGTTPRSADDLKNCSRADRCAVLAFEARDHDIEHAVMDQIKRQGMKYQRLAKSEPIPSSEGGCMSGTTRYYVYLVTRAAS